MMWERVQIEDHLAASITALDAGSGPLPNLRKFVIVVRPFFCGGQAAATLPNSTEPNPTHPYPTRVAPQVGAYQELLRFAAALSALGCGPVAELEAGVAEMFEEMMGQRYAAAEEALQA